jgi:hypothetical protein
MNGYEKPMNAVMHGHQIVISLDGFSESSCEAFLSAICASPLSPFAVERTTDECHFQFFKVNFSFAHFTRQMRNRSPSLAVRISMLSRYAALATLMRERLSSTRKLCPGCKARSDSVGLMTSPNDVMLACVGRNGTLFSAAALGIVFLFAVYLWRVNCVLPTRPRFGTLAPVKTLLLLIQTQSDVTALPIAAQVVKAERYEAVWAILSPAVLVDTQAAEAEHQRNLQGLEEAIARCAKTRDWGGAQAYETQLAAAKLQKVAAVKDAWKSLTEAEKKVAGDKIIQSFGSPCPNIRFQPLADHYEPAQFIDALNSIRKNWHAPCVPPGFTLTWASEMARNVSVQPVHEPVSQTATVTLEQVQQPPAGSEANKGAAPEEKKGYTHLPRFKELCKMGIEQLGEIALKLKLTPKGTRLGVAHQVMKAELAETA